MDSLLSEIPMVLAKMFDGKKGKVISQTATASMSICRNPDCGKVHIIVNFTKSDHYILLNCVDAAHAGELFKQLARCEEASE